MLDHGFDTQRIRAAQKRHKESGGYRVLVSHRRLLTRSQPDDAVESGIEKK